MADPIHSLGGGRERLVGFHCILLCESEEVKSTSKQGEEEKMELGWAEEWSSGEGKGERRRVKKCMG